MNQVSRLVSSRSAGMSPLVLSDRLLTLAEQADAAGYQAAARRLVGLAFSVLDSKLRERTPAACDASGIGF